ncbi:hypothetical protein EB231_22685 [Mesorhizobium sp. NZP2298]|nr:hypothetical protein EB231_22685 [Mesorhizobium sp. NZP2298]
MADADQGLALKDIQLLLKDKTEISLSDSNGLESFRDKDSGRIQKRDIIGPIERSGRLCFWGQLALAEAQSAKQCGVFPPYV